MCLFKTYYQIIDLINYKVIGQMVLFIYAVGKKFFLRANKMLVLPKKWIIL